MGYTENNEIIIEKASEPGPKAIHQLDYFKADPAFIDMFIDVENANSNGKLIYLGEWHTHPQIFPIPSKVDLISLSEIAQSKGDYCILLIVGSYKFQIQKFQKQSINVIKHKNSDDFFFLQSSY